MARFQNCLWFDRQEALRAAKFYCSAFRNSKVDRVTRHGDATSRMSGQKKGSILCVEFTLNGQKFLALNGGARFKFNESVSLVAVCKDQKEIDAVWKKLTSGGGKAIQCGWLKDKYGVVWQVWPEGIMDLHADPAGSDRVMAAIGKMKKLDAAALKRAYKGEK